MKAERRHELKENDLMHLLEQSWTYTSANAKRIGLIVIAAFALLLVVSLAMRSSAASIEDTWRRKDELKFDTPQEAKIGLQTLKELGNSASDQTFVLEAMMRRGSEALKFARKGSGNLPDKEMNQTAREAFEELLNRFPSNPLAFGVAHSGLATVEENAFVLDGDISHKEKTKNHLNKIIENHALDTTPFNRMALDRRAALDAVFQKIEFAPPASPDEVAGG